MPRWKAVEQLAHQAQPLVLPGRRNFFQAEALTQLELHLRSNLMLVDLSSAAAAQSSSVKRSDVEAAIGELGQILAALKAADYGRWDGFYTKGDWFVDIPLTLALAKVSRDKIEGKNLTAAQQAILNEAIYRLDHNTSLVFKKIKAYQDGQRVRFGHCTTPTHQQETEPAYSRPREIGIAEGKN